MNTNQNPSQGGSAGADWVTAVEVSGHMADAAAEALVANGFAARSVVVARDVRRVHADAQPGGRPADLDARADLVIFEARLRRTQPVAAHSDWWSCCRLYT